MENQLPEREEVTPEGLVARWVPGEIAKSFMWATSLPDATEEQRLDILSIIEGPYVDGSDIIGGTFSFSNYVAHPVQFVREETGELIQAIRCLLPQPEGPPIKFVSIGVLESLGRICSTLRRSPPFDPPLPVKLVQHKTRNGGRVFKLQVVKG